MRKELGLVSLIGTLVSFSVVSFSFASSALSVDFKSSNKVLKTEEAFDRVCNYLGFYQSVLPFRTSFFT